MQIKKEEEFQSVLNHVFDKLSEQDLLCSPMGSIIIFFNL